MDQAAVVRKTEDHVRQALQGEGSGHDWWHIHRVRALALRLAEGEPVDRFVVELAALLHDIADWKFRGGSEEAGPAAARAWLEGLAVDAAAVDRVCRVIREVSFKGAGVATPATSREAMIVQDADRLDALGAIGIARTFAYGGHAGHPLHDPDAAPELHASFAAYKAGRGTTINHFHEKLLLLKDRMHTPRARRIAEERHRYMEQFLERFAQEWRGEQ